MHQSYHTWKYDLLCFDRESLRNIKTGLIQAREASLELLETSFLQVLQVKLTLDVVQERKPLESSPSDNFPLRPTS